MDHGEDAITKHLIQTGSYAQLAGLLRQRLTAAGWYDKVQALAAQELSTSDNPAVPNVSAGVEKQALALVSDDIKSEMHQIIKGLIDDLVEKVD